MVISLRTFIETGKFGPISLRMHKDQVVEALGTDFLFGDFGGSQILRYGTYEFFIYTESQTIFAIQNDSLSELLIDNDHFSIDPWFLNEDDLPTFQEVKQQLESYQIPFEIRNTPSFNNEDHFYCTESHVTLDFREWPDLSPEDYQLTGIRLFEYG